MLRIHTCLLLALCFSAASLSAQIEFNPFKWFGGDDEALTAIDVATPAEEAEAAVMLDEAKAALEAGRSRAANRQLKRIIKRYPYAEAAAEARFLRGRKLMTQGRWRKAFEELQSIVAEQPRYERFDSVIGAQFECATALMEGARGRIFGIIPGFRQYSEAIRQFETIVINAPYGDYAPLALMNIALVAEQEGDTGIAIDALDRLINFYPQSMLAPDAYYNMAQTYADLVKGAQYDQGSTRQAISYYEDFMILFPESNYLGEVESNLESMQDLLARSRLNLGDFYFEYRSNDTAALVFYNETITIAPESEAAAEARARIADIEAGIRPTTSGNVVRRLLRIN
jgi:outer membrane protein assembly factor BamD